MKFFTLISTCLLFVGCSRSVPVQDGALAVQPPSGWQLERPRPGGLEFYTLTTSSGGKGMLMFSKWPPPSRPDEIPDLVKKLADGFVEQAKKSTEFTLGSSNYRVEQFTGNECSGSYATFQVKSNDTTIVQVVFMMTVGGQIWSGQFQGTTEQWTQAREMLTTIKKNG